jgi:hypothetical protein
MVTFAAPTIRTHSAVPDPVNATFSISLFDWETVMGPELVIPPGVPVVVGVDVVVVVEGAVVVVGCEVVVGTLVVDDVPPVVEVDWSFNSSSIAATRLSRFAMRSSWLSRTAWRIDPTSGAAPNTTPLMFRLNMSASAVNTPSVLRMMSPYPGVSYGSYPLNG